MIYTVTLNPALDYTVWVSDFEAGKTNRVARETLHFGGKGINVCAVLGALGEPSVALGFAAGFVGEAFCNMLHSAHITAGTERVAVAVNDLAPGVYIYSIRSATQKFFGQFIIK